MYRPYIASSTAPGGPGPGAPPLPQARRRLGRSARRFPAADDGCAVGGQGPSSVAGRGERPTLCPRPSGNPVQPPSRWGVRRPTPRRPPLSAPSPDRACSASLNVAAAAAAATAVNFALHILGTNWPATCGGIRVHHPSLISESTSASITCLGRGS